MVIRDILTYLEGWAPQGAAWEKDNVGLLIGSKERKVTKILVTLEINQAALESAMKNGCELIITHHPIIFKPIKKLDFDNSARNRLIKTLIQKNISVIAAHTNLDFSRDGVSFTLAEKLNLQNIDFLEKQESNQYKLTVFIPEDYVDNFSESLFRAGAGVIGEYNKCSFRSSGTGTFEGGEFTNPFLGKSKTFEKVKETRLEVLVNSWNLGKVISTLLENHPYEEPAYDIYPLKNKNANYGAGAVGYLKNPLGENDFLKYVSQKINSKNIRYCKGKKRKIKKVAVCGGSCGSLVNKAIEAGADAFITADVGYHTFEESAGKILLIDAGHYETEIHILAKIKKRLLEFSKQVGNNIQIITYSGNTNPVKFLIK